ncbi:ComEA family DNA-binding protein [Saccharothrix longispora]|uniref:ComEA family DNA-binding protein n=1 Tax=Saccharothrix longispora TaxID=33920 RepID=UPI0028FD62AE|nr:ComEA family DNA-binding protein [Saccharothrix longispora]MDU0293399.1 ComEA family DNA-binding protein [Saccharothrix longispora]
MKPETPQTRLQALIDRNRGRHRAQDAETLVFVSADTAAPPPPPPLGGLLRRLLPAAPSAPPRRRVVLAGVVAAVALVVALALWWQRPVTESPPDLPVAEAAAVTHVEQHLVVDVVGLVPTPGLVTVPSGARVADALKAAGGPNPGVDLSPLNLARKVTDGEQIAVGVPAPHSTDSATEPLNLNTATEEQLDTLPGVGPVTAQRIVDRRQKRGPFTSIDQLGEIEGIGDAKLAKLAELVRL